MQPVIAPEYCGLPCALVTDRPRARNVEFPTSSQGVAAEISAGYNALAARE